jgi:hypothetical protein
VDGLAADKVRDGRFLVLPTQIIDFKDAANDEFSIKNRTVLPLYKGCDQNTNVDFEYGKKSDAGDGYLLAQGYVLPRSTGFYGAEDTGNSCTSPRDNEEITYWDSHAKARKQARTRQQRFIEYKVDLTKYFASKVLKSCTTIYLLNRGKASYSASLSYANQSIEPGGYSCYRLTTSCGIALENVIHEAIWSHCGRYLAVVQFEVPPQVPHKISIIDFKNATVKAIAGIYALPSFIWFDETILDFTHLVGIEEQLSYNTSNNYDGAGNQVITRINQAEHSQEPYTLLFSSKNDRLNAMAAALGEHRRSSNSGVSDIIVRQISQHCMLFAPNFDAPVLQPPTGVKD